jgi:hypothetical protein
LLSGDAAAEAEHAVLTQSERDILGCVPSRSTTSHGSLSAGARIAARYGPEEAQGDEREEQEIALQGGESGEEAEAVANGQGAEAEAEAVADGDGVLMSNGVAIKSTFALVLEPINKRANKSSKCKYLGYRFRNEGKGCVNLQVCKFRLISCSWTAHPLSVANRLQHFMRGHAMSLVMLSCLVTARGCHASYLQLPCIHIASCIIMDWALPYRTFIHKSTSMSACAEHVVLCRCAWRTVPTRWVQRLRCASASHTCTYLPHWTKTRSWKRQSFAQPNCTTWRFYAPQAWWIPSGSCSPPAILLAI